MDLEKTFDRVPREELKCNLRKVGVDGWLIHIVGIVEARTLS